jgi:hypothetical protein
MPYYSFQNYARIIPIRSTGNLSVFGEISGSHGVEYDDSCLLGCCAA